MKNSLCFFWSFVIMSFLVSLALLGSIRMFVHYEINITEIITTSMLCIVFGLRVFLGLMLLLCSIVAFSASVIQFGLDQLHDAPAESLSLYIHWYVCSGQLGPFTIRLLSVTYRQNFFKPSIYTLLYYLSLIIGPTIAFLSVTLCLERYKHHWFLIDSGHTVCQNPIRRSAFTYCEDELPSRLDLGKEKYGGPFTTEEVGNVKAFLGILQVLLTFGPIVCEEFAFSDNLPSLG